MVSRVWGWCIYFNDSIDPRHFANVLLKPPNWLAKQVQRIKVNKRTPRKWRQSPEAKCTYRRRSSRRANPLVLASRSPHIAQAPAPGQTDAIHTCSVNSLSTQIVQVPFLSPLACAQSTQTHLRRPHSRFKSSTYSTRRVRRTVAFSFICVRSCVQYGIVRCPLKCTVGQRHLRYLKVIRRWWSSLVRARTIVTRASPLLVEWMRIVGGVQLYPMQSIARRSHLRPWPWLHISKALVNDLGNAWCSCRSVHLWLEVYRLYTHYTSVLNTLNIG